jgi:hypothetical protein
MQSRTRSLALLACVASAFSLIAAGCGGSSDKKANEAYANSVCTAVGNWQTQVKSLANFSGNATKASIQSKATQFETDTKNLVNQIKATPPPDTSEGKAAKQQLNQLSTDLTNTVDSVKSGLDQVYANPSAAAITAAVATLTPQLQNLIDTTKSTVSSLQQAGGSLADAFKSSDACKSLESGS